MARAAVASLAMLVVVASCSRGNDDSDADPAASEAAFVPDDGVDSETLAAQREPLVVVETTLGVYVTAKRAGPEVCMEVRASGTDAGPHSCVPANTAWPDGPLIARSIEIDGARFVVGAASVQRVDHLLIGDDRTRIELRSALNPFPTLTFFLLPDALASVSYATTDGSIGTSEVEPA